MTSRRWSHASTFVCLAASIITLGICACCALGLDAEGLKSYEAALASGDLANAVAQGAKLLAEIKAARPEAASVASIEARLAAIEDGRRLGVFKMESIMRGIGAEDPSPFLYIAPTPAELYNRGRDRFVKTALVYADFSEAEKSFVRSYLDAAMLVADKSVVEAHKGVVDGKPSDESARKARAYLTAYVACTHDEFSYPAVLPLIAKTVTGGALPVFMVEDALSELGDARAALGLVNVLDGATWAKWPEGKDIEVMKAIALFAENHGDRDFAIVVNNLIVTRGTSAESESAQLGIIRNAEKARDWAGAAAACGDFLKRYPESKDARNTGYLKASYEYQAQAYEAALTTLKQFREKFGSEEVMPNVLLLEGMSYSGLSKTDEALKSFNTLVEKYPKHFMAGKAEFLAGLALLSNQRYVEARQRFQRVVDFYPNDTKAPDAKSFLDRLKDIPTEKPK
jgi:outer membrane protein assembly factor BamD (BamD/ComL family)